MERQSNVEASKRWYGREPIRDFNALMTQAVDRTLEALIGSEAIEPLSKQLTKSPDCDQMPNKVDVVCSALENAFGVRGAQAIEWMMLKHVYDRIQLPIEAREGLTFEDLLETAKQRLNRDLYYKWVRQLSKSW